MKQNKIKASETICTYLLSCLLTYLFTYLLIHSLTHSIEQSPFHKLTDSQLIEMVNILTHNYIQH